MLFLIFGSLPLASAPVVYQSSQYMDCCVSINLTSFAVSTQGMQIAIKLLRPVHFHSVASAVRIITCNGAMAQVSGTRLY